MNRSKRKSNKPARARAAAQVPSSLGTLVGRAANIAKSIPVFGSIVDTAETVASSILSFLGLGSSMFQVHYNTRGVRFCIPHDFVKHDSLKGEYTSSNSTVVAGSILLRYELSIGPTGSRSRRMGENFEKYQMDQFQLAVTATCAATEPGQLAYVFVPDPLDRTLDTMDLSTRLEAILGRDNVQLGQIWQNTVLSFSLPRTKQFFVQPEAGDIRFSSPGAVYVVAVTPLDSTKLPTLRQTSSLKFLRATSAPLSYGVETMISYMQLKTSPNISTQSYLLREVGMGFNDHRNSFQTFGEISADCIRVRTGETINCAVSSTTGLGTNYPVGNAIVHFTSDGGVTSNLSVHLSTTNSGADVAKFPHTAVYFGVMPSDGYVWLEGVGTITGTGNYSHTALWIIYPETASLPTSTVSTSAALQTRRHENGFRCSYVKTALPGPVLSVVEPDEKKDESVPGASAQALTLPALSCSNSSSTSQLFRTPQLTRK